MEGNRTIYENATALSEYISSSGFECPVTVPEADVILGYFSDRNITLIADQEGNLFMDSEEHHDIPVTVDEIIDMVCEWNYEMLEDIQDKIDKPADFIEYCNCKEAKKKLSEEEQMLDRLFDHTIYGKECDVIANNLALELMSKLSLVPIYDIPVAPEQGIYKDRIVDPDDKMGLVADRISRAIDNVALDMNKSDATGNNPLITANKSDKAIDDTEIKVHQDNMVHEEAGRLR